MHKEPSRRRSAGYTLLEVITVTSIVAILATIAVPNFRYVTSSNRIASEVNALLGDLQFARSQAVKEGQLVTVCSSSSGTGCTNTAWQSGWIVFLDSNGDKAVQAGEAIIRTQPGFSGTDTFIATPGTFNAITYNRMGYAPTGQATAINVTLHDSTANTAWTRCVAINPIGSAVTEKYAVGTPACN
jgi:type IV fimbrial biogenesis protein FimT